MRSTIHIWTVSTACFVGLAFLTVSCSTGPAPPKVGTPAWSWKAATDTWANGDLVKTSSNLEPLIKPDSEYAQRAQPWRLVITGGLASGYMELADAFENGFRKNKGASMLFRRYMNDYRQRANKQALQFGQTYLAFHKTGGTGDIPIAFSFPTGSVLRIAEVSRASQGIALSAQEVTTAERRALRRGVLLAACSAVGAGNDSAKARQIFSSGGATIPRNTFLTALAVKLHDVVSFYSPSKMDRPDRIKFFDGKALDILKGLPETTDSKKLVKKIERELKAAAKRH